MFLIKYDDGQYIDAEKIEWLQVKDGKISFTVTADTDTIYTVGADYEDIFINNIYAIDDNNQHIKEGK